MTQAEWLRSTDPRPMLRLLSRHRLVSERKLRLFAVACCRRIWPLLAPEQRRLVELAEGYADGLVSEEKRRAVVLAPDLAEEGDEAGGHAASGALAAPMMPDATFESAVEAAADAADTAAGRDIEADLSGGREPEVVFADSEFGRQCELLRDIVCSPFRPVAFSPTWRTEIALSLAQQVYDARNFGTMPTLADALQDAGCDSDDILDHCRDANATHVRGCWVVDLVLGRE